MEYYIDQTLSQSFVYYPNDTQLGNISRTLWVALGAVCSHTILIICTSFQINDES